MATLLAKIEPLHILIPSIVPINLTIIYLNILKQNERANITFDGINHSQTGKKMAHVRDAERKSVWSKDL